MSVAVATCGRPAALATCLAALAAQTRRPDQVIVVDQGPAAAKTVEVIKACGLAVDYRVQPRLGLSASRNLALGVATGDFLAVTDDDCFADSRWCAALLAAFASEAAPSAVTGPILPPPTPAPENMCALSLRPSRETVAYDRRVPPWVVGSGANFAARPADLRALGGWNEKLGVGTAGQAAEDCELTYRFLVRGWRVLYDGEVLVHHAWQTRDRRWETRRTYGFGIGALSGSLLRRGDLYAIRMLGSYIKQHLRQMVRACGARDSRAVLERLVALGALPAGLFYGARLAGSGTAPSSHDDKSRPVNS